MTQQGHDRAGIQQPTALSTELGPAVGGCPGPALIQPCTQGFGPGKYALGLKKSSFDAKMNLEPQNEAAVANNENFEPEMKLKINVAS